MVDITEQVKAQPRGGVIVITGLEVSDEDGESGGSGFDVEVGDWGDRTAGLVRLQRHIQKNNAVFKTIIFHF